MFKATIVGGVLLSVILVLALLLLNDNSSQKEKNTISLIKTTAEAVRFYSEQNGGLPESLNQVTATPPIVDLFGKNLDYAVLSTNRFAIESAGLNQSASRYIFEIRSNNLVFVTATNSNSDESDDSRSTGE